MVMWSPKNIPPTSPESSRLNTHLVTGFDMLCLEVMGILSIGPMWSLLGAFWSGEFRRNGWWSPFFEDKNWNMPICMGEFAVRGIFPFQKLWRARGSLDSLPGTRGEGFMKKQMVPTWRSQPKSKSLGYCKGSNFRVVFCHGEAKRPFGKDGICDMRRFGWTWRNQHFRLRFWWSLK